MDTLHTDTKVLCISIPDEYVEHGNVELLKREVGIDADSIVERIVNSMGKDEKFDMED